jgi:hypothetical protein
MSRLEQIRTLVSNEFLVKSTCSCDGLPPTSAECWVDDLDAPNFGVSTISAPPPHDVLLWVQFDPHPWEVARNRVSIWVCGPYGCENGHLTLNSDDSRRLAAALNQAANEFDAAQ